jgi:hypothetical protein
VGNRYASVANATGVTSIAPRNALPNAGVNPYAEPDLGTKKRIRERVGMRPANDVGANDRRK